MAAGFTSDKHSIYKLEGDANWTTWRIQMKHVLRSRKFWKLVTGEEKLKDDPSAVEKQAFEDRQQDALTTIIVAVNPSVVSVIGDIEDPKQAWDSLVDYYEKNTVVEEFYLRKQYYRKDMAEGASAEKHVREMKELTDKLAAMGSPVSEHDQMMLLMMSLPATYRSLVTTLYHQLDKCTLSYVQKCIKDEELRNRHHAVDGEEQALVGATSSKKSSGSKPRFKCFNCGMRGHYSRDCKNTPASSASQSRPQQQHHRPRKPDHRARAHVAETQSQDNDEFLFCTVTSDTTMKENAWVIDSGASSHMTWDKQLLEDYHVLSKEQTVKLGDGRSVKAIGTGTIRLRLIQPNGRVTTNVLSGVLYVPDLSCNLMSVRVLTDRGFNITFDGDKCVVVTKTDGKSAAVGMRDGGSLYYLHVESAPTECAHVAAQADVNLWHSRLGHVCDKVLEKMTNEDVVKGVNVGKMVERDFCEGCARGKIHRTTPKGTGDTKTTRRLELVHSDVCGPMHVKSMGGKCYVMTLTDDYTRIARVYFLTHKSEALDSFKDFHARVVGETGENIGSLRSDRGGEYVSKQFAAYLRVSRINQQVTDPDTPEQNGISERLNRTLIEKARSMLAHGGLAKGYWAEAVNTATYLYNRTPSSALGGKKTPYEAWYGKAPDLSHVRVFGCVAYAHIADGHRRKLDDKAVKLRLIGYSLGTRGYRLYDPVNKKLVCRRDVWFDEKRFKMSDTDPEVTSPQSIVTFSGKKPEAAVPVARQQEVPPAETEPAPAQDRVGETRQRRPPVRYGIDEAYLGEEAMEHCALFVSGTVEPVNMTQAMNSSEADQWKAAADEEYKSLMDHETWTLAKLPAGRSLVGSKWVFKLKLNEAGNISRFKCRLVAQGFSQKPGLDYEETFAPVAKFGTIHALLALGAQRGMHIHQMDVKTAFLNGRLKEDIYMRQPEGYVSREEPDMVCHLKKSLYGLKQSPRCWYEELRLHLVDKLEYTQSLADPCVFYKWENDNLTIITMYVDDLILLVDSMEMLLQLKRDLSDRFHMTDLGELKFILGISVSQTEEQLQIHQRQYIQSMLKKFGMEKANGVAIPADPNVRLVEEDGISKPADKEFYQRLVGSLQYAANGSRPDIAFAVNLVARYTNNPSELHLTCAKRILRYLKDTAHLALTYTKGQPDDVVGYSDADWAGEVDKRRSTSGFVFLLSNGAITWASRKQTSVALSTVEAEYMALSLAAQEAIWLRQLMSELGKNAEKPTTIWGDNQGAISVAKNPIFSKRSKHIHIRYHFVREQVEEGTIDIDYCPGTDMTADVHTKALARDRFQMLRDKLGLKQIK